MKDLVCKTCASNLKFNGKIKIKCDYCGNEYLLDSFDDSCVISKKINVKNDTKYLSGLVI